MTIGVLKEPAYETRVSLLPESAATLIKKGITILVESGAGHKAFSTDEDYQRAGVQVVNRQQVLKDADLLLSIQSLPPGRYILNPFENSHRCLPAFIYCVRDEKCGSK